MSTTIWDRPNDDTVPISCAEPGCTESPVVRVRGQIEELTAGGAPRARSRQKTARYCLPHGTEKIDAMVALIGRKI